MERGEGVGFTTRRTKIQIHEAYIVEMECAQRHEGAECTPGLASKNDSFATCSATEIASFASHEF